MAWRLYDYLNQRGDNEVADWTRGLQKSDRARLNQKLDMLERYGIDGLPPKLVAGPLGGHRHIYKLRIDGSVAMRPMLCKGPIDMNREFTLLLGATERDRVLDPMDAPRRAEQRRTEIIANPTRRCNHERVAK